MRIEAGPGTWEIEYHLSTRTLPGTVVLSSVRYRLDWFTDDIPAYSDNMLPYFGARLIIKFQDLVKQHHKTIK